MDTIKSYISKITDNLPYALWSQKKINRQLSEALAEDDFAKVQILKSAGGHLDLYKLFTHLERKNLENRKNAITNRNTNTPQYKAVRAPDSPLIKRLLEEQDEEERRMRKKY